MNISRYRLLNKALRRVLIGTAVTAALYASTSFVTAVERHYSMLQQCEADIFCDD